MTYRVKNFRLLTKVAKQMHDEIMSKILVYARMVDNSDDLRNEEFQGSLVYLASSIIAGIMATHGRKRDDDVKGFLDNVMLSVIVGILETNDVEEGI